MTLNDVPYALKSESDMVWHQGLALKACNLQVIHLVGLTELSSPLCARYDSKRVE